MLEFFQEGTATYVLSRKTKVGYISLKIFKESEHQHSVIVKLYKTLVPDRE